MSLDLTQLVVADFSGGITDYILDAQPNQAATMENFLIDPNKKAVIAPGSQVFASNMYQIPDGNVRISGAFASVLPELFLAASRKLWVPNTSAFLELVGPSSNPAYSLGDTTTQYAFAEWNEHVFSSNTLFASPIKMYKDGSNVWQTRTAGLPDLATSPTCTSSGGTGNSYIYAFHYYYTYTVGTTVFEDYGPTTIVSVTNAGAPNVNQINIAAVPTLANGATLNYDTSNLKVYIYRTQAGGTVLYKIGQVNNGTATFTDNFADTTISTNLLLYTNSGVLDNDPPPLCKYIHTVNGVCYYAHTKSGSQVFKNRVFQSVQDDPDSVPTTNYIDLLDEITGISSYTDNPIVFTKNHAYRLNGSYNELGQGTVSFEDITKTIGCVSHNSIVQTRYGVFWAGNDGFYWTDGFSFKKISDSINNTYKTLVTSQTEMNRICGTYDTKDNRVIWAVSLNDSSTDNDAFVVLDLRWGIRDASTFTTRTNGDSFSPTAVTFYNKQLIRADRRGYVFKHDASYTTDPKVDTSKTPSQWTTKGIVPLYKSAAFNFSLPVVRKWVPKILTTFENVTNASIQVSRINDNSSGELDTKEIRYRGNFVWGDPTPTWGTDSYLWSFYNLIEEMRRFPAGGLRCSYMQVVITQSFTNIYNSDSLGLATVDTGTKTVTLASGSWPTEIVDYYVSLAGDGYVEDLQITAVSGGVLTYLDPLSSADAGSQKWLIRGNPKGEVINMLSYIVYFAPMTDQSYKTWRTEQDSTGANA
jgi:hypothetical protein